MTRCYVLLGGFIGIDGWVTSAGITTLAKQIGQVPGVSVKTFTWSAWQNVATEIKRLPREERVAIVGYSGGCQSASYIANRVDGRPLDLIFGLDPSPAAGIEPFVKGNVVKAICWHNRAPFFLWYGGGLFKGPTVEVRQISENHLAVQFDQTIRDQVIEKLSTF